jgi:hypothetical protein
MVEDRADRHLRLRSNAFTVEMECQEGRRRHILRPSCVAGTPSGDGAVTMKDSDYGVP